MGAVADDIWQPLFDSPSNFLHRLEFCVNYTSIPMIEIVGRLVSGLVSPEVPK